MKLSVKEGVYYAAWMFGIIVTVPFCRSMGVHHLVSLAIGVAVGWGLGVAAERVYDARQSRKSNDDQPFGGSRDDFLK